MGLTQDRWAILLLLNGFLSGDRPLPTLRRGDSSWWSPIVMPLVQTAGIDPVHFGLVVNAQPGHWPADAARRVGTRDRLLGREGGHLGCEQGERVLRRGIARRAFARNLRPCDSHGFWSRCSTDERRSTYAGRGTDRRGSSRRAREAQLARSGWLARSRRRYGRVVGTGRSGMRRSTGQWRSCVFSGLRHLGLREPAWTRRRMCAHISDAIAGALRAVRDCPHPTLAVIEGTVRRRRPWRSPRAVTSVSARPRAASGRPSTASASPCPHSELQPLLALLGPGHGARCLAHG